MLTLLNVCKCVMPYNMRTKGVLTIAGFISSCVSSLTRVVYCAICVCNMQVYYVGYIVPFAPHRKLSEYIAKPGAYSLGANRPNWV